MNYYNKQFSHLYVEDDILEYTFTNEVLSKFKKSDVIHIKNYQEVFFRPNQSFDIQKNSKAMILAKKRDSFIYDGSKYAQGAGFNNYSYNTLIQK